MSLGWRYRVILDSDGMYRIAEVYPNPDGGPPMWTAEPVAPVSETLTGLEMTLRRMLRALDHDPPALAEADMLAALEEA